MAAPTWFCARRGRRPWSFNTVYASMLVRAARPAEAKAVAEKTARLTSSKGDKSGEAHSLLWAAVAACELRDFGRCESLLG